MATKRKRPMTASEMGKKARANQTAEERREQASKAGTARAKKLSKKRRSEIASAAGKAGAAARWGNKTQEKSR